jgi:hypothetical protein
LTILDIKAIKPKNRWNINKAGIMEGIEDNKLVVRSVYTRFVQKKQLGLKAWTFFIKCIFALSKSLFSLVIFKGKSL